MLINISRKVKKDLWDIRREEGHKTFDSVIRDLLSYRVIGSLLHDGNGALGR